MLVRVRKNIAGPGIEGGPAGSLLNLPDELAQTLLDKGDAELPDGTMIAEPPVIGVMQEATPVEAAAPIEPEAEIETAAAIVETQASGKKKRGE